MAKRMVAVAICIVLAVELGFGVFAATIYSYLFCVPNCVARNAGFGVAMPGLLMGVAGALFVVPAGIYISLSPRPGPYRMGGRLLKMFLFALLALLLSFVGAFILSGSILHLGKHNCHRIPWSP